MLNEQEFSLKNRFSQIKIVRNISLRDSLENLLEHVQTNLHGLYELCSIYQNLDNETYALIYATYSEKDIKEEELISISEKDAYFLDQKIKEQNIMLDYIFIIPYYDYVEQKKCSLMSDAIITKK